MGHRRPIGSRAVRAFAPGAFPGATSGGYWPVRPRERASECPARGCEVMVLPSEAATPAGHCALHAEHYRPSGGPRRGRRRTECEHGHDLTISANITRDGRGRRACRVCQLARQRRLDARVCGWEGCEVSLAGHRHNRKYCDQHQEEARRAKQRDWHRRKAAAA
jgi:hypothetical protein